MVTQDQRYETLPNGNGKANASLLEYIKHTKRIFLLVKCYVERNRFHNTLQETHMYQ